MTDILCNYIHFDIDPAPIAILTDSCVRERVRNYRNDDMAWVGNMGHGKAHAIDRKRSFRDHKFGDFGRQLDREQTIFVAVHKITDNSDAVDVTLHEVAAERGHRGGRSFQVHVIARNKFSHGRSRQRLSHRRYAKLPAGDALDGMTDTIDRHTVAGFQSLTKVFVRAQREAASRIGPFDRNNFSERFDNAGKHTILPDER